MSELVSRLRGHYDHVTTYGGPGDDSADLVKEAADRIHELQAEVARLTECLRIANANTERFEREWYLRGDKIEAAEANYKSAISLANSYKSLLEAAEAKLKAVGELPGKWRQLKYDEQCHSLMPVAQICEGCADELAALLKEDIENG